MVPKSKVNPTFFKKNVLSSLIYLCKVLFVCLAMVLKFIVSSLLVAAIVLILCHFFLPFSPLSIKLLTDEQDSFTGECRVFKFREKFLFDLELALLVGIQEARSREEGEGELFDKTFFSPYYCRSIRWSWSSQR